MVFNNHYKLQGLHAPFSASQSSWLRYEDDKVIQYLENMKAKQRGTDLHNWAKTTIDLCIKQRKSKDTLSAYVNDAIGFKMDTEVILFYSENCFGTADSISFRNNFLRIHDLKTGTTPVKMDQLEIYAALFCLEYHVDPNKIEMELRIYQNDEIIIHNPKAEDIIEIMNKIVHIDEIARNNEGRL